MSNDINNPGPYIPGGQRILGCKDLFVAMRWGLLEKLAEGPAPLILAYIDTG
jgi:hypothetical protein